MLKSAVIDHFKNASNVARALSITPAAVWKWGDVVPWFSAGDVQRITGGALKRIDGMYDSRGRPKSVERAASEVRVAANQ